MCSYLRTTVEIFQDGLVEYHAFDLSPDPDDETLPANWVLALLANTLWTVDRVRTLGRAPAAEYAIEVTAGRTVGSLVLQRLEGAGRFYVKPTLEANPLVLPRVSYRSPGDLNALITDAARDLYHAGGIPYNFGPLTVLR